MRVKSVLALVAAVSGAHEGSRAGLVPSSAGETVVGTSTGSSSMPPMASPLPIMRHYGETRILPPLEGGVRKLDANGQPAVDGDADHSWYTGPTVGSICPEPEFRKALARVGAYMPNATERLGGVDTIVQAYRDVHMDTACVDGPDSKAWPESKGGGSGAIIDELFVNAGDGSTGTRWVHCVMQTLGLHSLHFDWYFLRDKFPIECNPHEVAAKNSHANRTECDWPPDVSKDGQYYLHGALKSGTPCPKSCTEFYDHFDYVADTEVPEHLAGILASHPGSKTAGVIQTLRDPFDWRKDRWEKHGQYGPATAPCGNFHTSVSSSDVQDAPMTEFIYNAWAACMAVKGRKDEDLLPLNLFTSTSLEAAAMLQKWLNGRGPWKTRPLTVERVNDAINSCPYDSTTWD